MWNRSVLFVQILASGSGRPGTLPHTSRPATPHGSIVFKTFKQRLGMYFGGEGEVRDRGKTRALHFAPLSRRDLGETGD